MLTPADVLARLLDKTTMYQSEKKVNFRINVFLYSVNISPLRLIFPCKFSFSFFFFFLKFAVKYL